MSKVDEEGLELAVCRHGVLLHALNMFRGEIFAYPMYLQRKLSDRSPQFFAMDVCCKYWPYLGKIAEKCPELEHLLHMRPFLSVFHAKAHDFKCEVKKIIFFTQHFNMILLEDVYIYCSCCLCLSSILGQMEWGISGGGRFNTWGGG